MEDKCVAIIQKKIIMKIITWWRGPYKISRQIASTQTCGLASYFKAWNTDIYVLSCSGGEVEGEACFPLQGEPCHAD